MKSVRRIELLTPARDLECGLAAVDHGADAVYIGAPKFGARAAAPNSLDDIRRLADYAHLYNVRVYVALNTILTDKELLEIERLIDQLYRIGTDALIVQDMGITRLSLPPIPLHASTQMDNRTPQKVRFLADAGFRQVVLARELSLTEIGQIHRTCPDVSLEVFVHGALCVSYSGQCYASQACFNRSANRGECAQFCRLPFDWVDADHQIIARGKHFLSLKDLNRLDQLEALLDAGVTSLKIEGRLKDASYVKNVTAAYRQRLDSLFIRRPEYARASSGSCTYTFTPNVEKSFNRSFTSYFLNGRGEDVASFNTPKSLGEEMGTLKEQRAGYMTVAGVKPFHNGDGVCYLDSKGRLQGFRINKVEKGNRLYPAAGNSLLRIAPHTRLYRNYDQDFERLLARKSAERTIAIRWEVGEHPHGFTLTVADEDDNRVALPFAYPKETARTPQANNIRTILSKLGQTPFRVHNEQDICITLSSNWFLPASILTEWRRKAIELLTKARRINYRREIAVWHPSTHPYPEDSLTYLGNVMNEAAYRFYQTHGVRSIAPAYEQQPVPNAILMTCRHCLRYSMGWCPTRQGKRSPYREPYFLVSADGRRFRLSFDCKNCLMLVHKNETE